MAASTAGISAAGANPAKWLKVVKERMKLDWQPKDRQLGRAHECAAPIRGDCREGESGKSVRWDTGECDNEGRLRKRRHLTIAERAVQDGDPPSKSSGEI